MIFNKIFCVSSRHWCTIRKIICDNKNNNNNNSNNANSNKFNTKNNIDMDNNKNNNIKYILLDSLFEEPLDFDNSHQVCNFIFKQLKN